MKNIESLSCVYSVDSFGDDVKSNIWMRNSCRHALWHMLPLVGASHSRQPQASVMPSALRRAPRSAKSLASLSST